MTDRTQAAPTIPAFGRQAAWAISLLVASTAYAVAIWSLAPYINGMPLAEAMLYGLYVWLIAGAVSFAVFACIDGVSARAVKLFYLLWAVGIPLIEIPLSVRAHADHWLF